MCKTFINNGIHTIQIPASSNSLLQVTGSFNSFSCYTNTSCLCHLCTSQCEAYCLLLLRLYNSVTVPNMDLNSVISHFSANIMIKSTESILYQVTAQYNYFSIFFCFVSASHAVPAIGKLTK